MGLLAFGIVLILIGVVLAATNLLGLAILAGPLVWLGWVTLGIGVILAILHFALGPRRTVIERERRTL